MKPLLCLFFFQAEDGIRDGRVTGVQTCALPISTVVHPSGARATVAPLSGTPVTSVPIGAPLMATNASNATYQNASATRSEERRVGKSVDIGGRRSIKKKTKS